MFARNWRFLVALVALVAIAGCGGQSTGPETVKVTGTVTYNDTAVDGATVTFSPKGAAGSAATGRTDAEGNYELTTTEQGDGAMVGSYAVSIRKLEGGPQEAQVGGTESDDELDAAYGALDAMGEEQEQAAVKHLLPEKYANPNESGFTAEVTADGENNFPFDLKD